MIEPDARPLTWPVRLIRWTMILWLTSLTACTTIVAGNFCDVYRVVDMPGEQAKRLDRKYQDRILSNEKFQFENCP